MKHVLVVESDFRVGRAIQKILSAAPLAVSFAFDADAAVAEARRDNPDMVIVDLGLPTGSGLLVIEALRALTACMRIPIIAIAGHEARLEAEHVFAAGANAFLPKPLRTHLLLQYVVRLLPFEERLDIWLETVQPLAE